VVLNYKNKKYWYGLKITFVPSVCGGITSPLVSIVIGEEL
jgi:hypothetical protein